MPSPINTPMPVLVTGVTTSGAAEFVIATIANVNLDNLETIVLLQCDMDVLNSSSGVSLTLKIRRGTGTGGASVATFGPFGLTASVRSNPSMSAFDQPGMVGSMTYTITGTVASNAGTFTVETALLSCQCQAAS
jgi:hypothetical protein